jgi:hypothetical protein
LVSDTGVWQGFLHTTAICLHVWPTLAFLRSVCLVLELMRGSSQLSPSLPALPSCSKGSFGWASTAFGCGTQESLPTPSLASSAVRYSPCLLVPAQVCRLACRVHFLFRTEERRGIMPRWIFPVSGVVLGAFGAAWLFLTKQGAHARQQVMKHGRLLRKQGERTLTQVSRQVQGGTQDLLAQGRRLAGKVTRKLPG